MSINIIHSFFKPTSVAVVGATASEKKAGYAVLRNIVKSGYTGKVYPVNPKRKEIMGIPVYNDIMSIPETPELAVLIIPPTACIEAIQKLGKKGTKAVLIISAGFKETGEEGRKLEEELLKTAKKHGIRIAGPNCLGVMDTYTPFNATFATVMPPQGNVAVVSQSGALLSAFFDWSIEEGVGFSKVVSLGNQADLSESDFIEYLAEDPETKVILAYIEGVRDGKRFIESLKKATKEKPVVVLKVGRTEAGARASSSHTGSITGSDDAYNAAFKKAGVIRATNMEELFIAAKLFSFCDIKRVNQVAILTNAGGPGIIASDAIENSSIQIATLEEHIKEKLKQVLPPMASVNNPVDIIGDADSHRYSKALDILLQSENVDSIIILLTPQLMTEISETAREIAKRKGRKTIVTTFMGRKRVREGVEILKAHHIPNYDFPEHVVKALDLMNAYLEKREGFNIIRLDDIKEVQLCTEGAKALDEYPAMNLLESFGIKTPKRLLVRTEDDLEKAVNLLTFPVVMKISSPKILHKTDVGGVIAGIKSKEEARESMKILIEKANRVVNKEDIRGVLIEEMAPEGVDTILGFKKDEVFGFVVIFGLGGIYVEILKDVSFGIAPVSEEEALSMIKSLKSFPILQGTRGGIKANLQKLAKVISKFSTIPITVKQLKEGEINPLRITEDDIIALDARFILES